MYMYMTGMVLNRPKSQLILFTALRYMYISMEVIYHMRLPNAFVSVRSILFRDISQQMTT